MSRTDIFLLLLDQRSTHAMLSPSDIHQPDSDPLSPPPPPSHHPTDQKQTRSRFSPSDTPHSDSGLSISSSSSGEVSPSSSLRLSLRGHIAGRLRPHRSLCHSPHIHPVPVSSIVLRVYLIHSWLPQIMGTPFDLGAQRFEYPFPQAQGSPTDPFRPLSSSITSHSHAQLPPWPVHISKSFPLTPPPLGKLKAHPKLRSASVREPPVPPGLVKRRSRIAGVQHQSSSEEPSDKSDVSDEIARAQRPLRFPFSLTEVPRRNTIQSDDATLRPSEIVPMKQAASFPIGSFDRPNVEDPAGLVTGAERSAEGTPRPPVVSASAYNTT